MKWKQMLFTIVLNIFLMLFVSIALEYSDLTERFVSIEDTVQEALDMALSASVHSEEFFSADYQANMLMSYAGTGSNTTAASTTLIWFDGLRQFQQVNTYQYAKWFDMNGRMPSSSADLGNIRSIGAGYRYGLSGYVFDWLYGGVGSGYNASGLAYANKNSARRAEYAAEGMRANDNYRRVYNSNFRTFYNLVGNRQTTTGYLKERTGPNSYKLSLLTYPTLQNMGLSWMGGYTTSTSSITSDNLCSSLHIGKSRSSQAHTYYFLTPASLGVTYVPVEVLKPVFIANLDTIVRLNKLAAANTNINSGDATSILLSASQCVETSVWDYNVSNGRYAELFNQTVGHASHIESSFNETIVTDGLVEFDLSTVQVKVDYFYNDFATGSVDDNALLISKLNGTLTGGSSETTLRRNTLTAFLNQDTSRYVSNFNGTSYNAQYNGVSKGRIIARVSVKMKVHVPYKSSMLQWICYMYTGTHHYDIKRWNPEAESAVQTWWDGDGLWYQYTTYYMTSRS